MGDTYTWATPGSSGSFDAASDWVDVTNTLSDTFPGTADVAYLSGLATGTVQTIDGPGDVGTLNVTGLNFLTGQFITGSTNVDNTNPAGSASLDLGGTLTADLGLTIGNEGGGSMDVESGASVSVGTSTDGASQLVLGNLGGATGSLTVLAGGTFTLVGPTETSEYGAFVGNNGTGELIISGSGATVNDANSDGIVVGYTTDSSGTLIVEGGASATFGSTNSDALAAIGVGRGGDGTITVDGSGSPGTTLTANGGVYIGRGAAGVLVISNDGVLNETVANTYFQIGVGSSSSNSHIGGTGSATVESDGTLSIAGFLLVGGNGVNGALTISTGGIVSATVSTLDSGIQIGNSATITGTPELGTGSIEIDAGGTLEATGSASPGFAGLSIGHAVGTQGTVSVIGGVVNAGSNSIVVGSTGEGWLDVSAGGHVTAASPGTGLAALVIGNAVSGVGTLDVSGVGSTVSANGLLLVGNTGDGALSIDGGGHVSANDVSVGAVSGSGVATVGGSGTLTVTGSVDVGGTASDGMLMVSGGLVTADAIGVGIGGSVTLDGGTLDAVSGGISIASGGQISGGGVIDGVVTNASTITANGTLTLSNDVSGSVINIFADSDLVLDAGASGGQVAFGSGAAERLDLLAPGGFADLIADFNTSDAIFVQGAASIVDTGGFGITLDGAGGAPVGTIDFSNSFAAGAFVDNNDTITLAPSCFAAGTQIATPRGDTPVEALLAGETVLLADGGTAPIVWLGQRRVDCARHPRPRDVLPVRVRAHAFGRRLPHTDLLLSPDHAVFCDGYLIPIRHLINGATVVQEQVDDVSYWHVELPRHAVLLAEGLPTESFLDTGNRAAFSNGGPAVQLHPDFSTRMWDADSCAPLVLAGPRLVAVKRRLLARAKRLGHTPTATAGRDVPVDSGAPPAETGVRRAGARLPRKTPP
jgi:collagen type I alpha